MQNKLTLYRVFLSFILSEISFVLHEIRGNKKKLENILFWWIP